MYDFTSMISRRNTDSVKWDVKPNELPMWVADMDFKVAPEILDAMRQKVDFGIFGYEEPHADYFDAVAHWYQTGLDVLFDWRCADDILSCSPRHQCG